MAHVISGRTPIGGWIQYTPKSVMLKVDTRLGNNAQFERVPQYFASLGGETNHWDTHGVSSIYVPTPEGFEVYVRDMSANPALNASDVNSAYYGWYVNWVGIEMPAIVTPPKK